MAQFIFTSKKQKDAAIRNTRKNLTQDNANGKMHRKSFYKLTGNKIFTDSSFEKRQDQGRTYSKKQIETAINKASRKAEKELKKEWKELRVEEKKKGVKVKNRTKWREFKEANSQPDFEEIKESFNSPV